ncbi:hypothetical protein PI95_031725 [Hassallia byssoidea VB512170]|uniref:Uncharacterized protein n=1 Tax=Hassallia byssoidea VB512170 TaxID=1304833 RepID=A0A846HK34_9CYAN|nr:hypothetical protein [Hassalia byssoidea]NEU76944.1 hypothetical protein [Hassalia byssoidea VB512170]
MSNFPSFGNANRAAPLFQKEIFPNIQFATNINSSPNSPKTVIVAISMTNLRTESVNSTLERLFNYAVESANNEMNSSTTILASDNVLPTIHFEIDISKATSQGGNLVVDSAGGHVSGAVTYTTVKTANIDILIENLQITLLASTLQRIKTYMATAVSADLNP